MLPSIIIGAIFFLIVAWAFNRTRQSIKNNSCPGCSGGCSEQQRKSCHK